MIGLVKSPSGRCSLPVSGEWRHGEKGWPHKGGRREQRGAWDDLSCLLGKWLVEAVIHHPGCTQDWIHGILTIFTPATKLAHLKTMAGKSFSLDLLGPWGNYFLNYTYKEAIKKEQWINLDFRLLLSKGRDDFNVKAVITGLLRGINWARIPEFPIQIHKPWPKYEETSFCVWLLQSVV